MPNTKDNKNKEKEVLTKEDFLKTLKKVTATVPKSSEKEKSETSADRPSGDYNEKHTH